VIDVVVEVKQNDIKDAGMTMDKDGDGRMVGTAVMVIGKDWVMANKY
jgi:hypothetical protein